MAATHPTILIVDDEFFLAETIKLRLESEGYQVLYAENGLEGVEVARQSRPNLIIMDYLMPVMDGVEATKQLKADPALAKIPVVFLTALARPQDSEKARAAGANDYLIKPFEMSDLMDLIQKWLVKK